LWGKREIKNHFCVSVFLSDINSASLLKNLPQTVSVLGGVTIGSSVFQPNVDDKDISDSHAFSLSYSPPEDIIYLDVSKTGK
jgi:hypothetical protein